MSATDRFVISLSLCVVDVPPLFQGPKHPVAGVGATVGSRCCSEQGDSVWSIKQGLGGSSFESIPNDSPAQFPGTL